MKAIGRRHQIAGARPQIAGRAPRMAGAVVAAATALALTLSGAAGSAASSTPAGSAAAIGGWRPAPRAAMAAKPPAKPVLVTGGAGSINYSAATIAGTVKPEGLETSYFFEFGPTTAYGAQTTAALAAVAATQLSVHAELSGLQLGTTYHYRLVGVNALGRGEGADRTFTTKALALRFQLPELLNGVYGRPYTIAGIVTGTASAGRSLQLQADPYPYAGPFVAVGAPVTSSGSGFFLIHVPRLLRNERIRIAAGGSPPQYSKITTLHVAVRPTITVRATGSAGNVVVIGFVRPPIRGARVVIQELRPAGGAVKVGEGRLTGGSRFSVPVRLRHGGRIRAYVQLPAESAWDSAVTKSVFVAGSSPK